MRPCFRLFSWWPVLVFHRGENGLLRAARGMGYSDRFMTQFRTIEQSFDVHFAYPVIFTRNLFASENPVLGDTFARGTPSGPARALVLVDAGVAAAAPGLVDRIAAHFAARPDRMTLVRAPQTVPGGERCKNSLQVAGDLLALFALHKMDRHSYVVAVGGGGVLDAVGFGAALFHRGLRLIRVPTTVLAQNDAGIGVKNAVNFMGAKNLIGSFAPPFAVLNDLAFLDALPQQAWIDGVAEAFKVAIIKDAAFFGRLCELAPRLAARDAAAMEETVVRCAELHLDHIRTNGDPFEFGRARPLDFGHWSAHKLERMSSYAMSHGAAVATGIALDSCYAVSKGWLEDADCARICAGLSATGFQLWSDLLEARVADGSLEVLRGLADFREHLGGELCVTMPKGIGAKFEIHEMDPKDVERAIANLKSRVHHA